MAVLVPNDWRKMDVSSTTNPRQRSPANDHSTPIPQLQQQLPAYTYPIQQQPQGGWTPSIAAAPFYPSHFQNPHHQQSPQPFAAPIPHQFPYFDPANAQFAAQWAYQRMMFNAQPGFPPMQPPQHRTASNSSSPNDYFPQNQAPFNPFPSGTPPPRSPSGDHPQGPQQQQPSQNGPYAGFHPYRRPNRQNTHASDTSDWRPGPNLSPFPPYARPDATGSTSSISSTSSQRQRTSSNQSVHSSHNSPSANGSARSRPNGSVPSRNTPSSATSSGPSPLRIPHHRNSSSSSSGSTATTTSSRPPALSPTMSATTTSTTSTSAVAISGATATPRPARPSPLSQGNFTAADKRVSRDDSDLATMLESSQASSSRSGGLKGRLRRALSFNVLREDETPESSKASNSKLKSKSPAPVNPVDGKPGSSGEIDSGVDDGASTATVQAKKKSRTASLFNSRINASTDNISLSSTVSSASVMIRKLGSMGKLARRNSLAGITSLFKDKEKDKDKDKDKDGDKKGKKDKKISSAKAGASEASVSHVTAELDRISNGDWAVDLQGLSPAAKLARQHTLKTNAEAAAKAKAQQEAQVAAAAAVTESPQVNGMSGVPAWERGTTTRQSASPVKPGEVKVNEDGTKVVVEDDEEDSDDGHYNSNEPGNFSMDGWDDDEDWDVDPDGDEDLTIRATLESTHIETDVEPWAVGVRRSLERTKRPSKGILKNPGTYDQEAYHTDQPAQVRARSNSYNSHPGPSSELGPLARIPSPDPDHIDGLHRHNTHSSGHGNASPSSSLQPPPHVSSPSTALSSDPSKKFSDLPLMAPHPPEKSIFQHPTLNSSAPTLSLTMSSSSPPIPHRSATSPAKRLAFANNLSVYDTFSSTVYDRRSEPATWSRLTPALAQRIKEELNSYKMEEMEVHAASRIHTQFFV